MGQTISENKRKAYVLILRLMNSPGLVNASHTNPSANCWIAKRKGMLANTLCEGLVTTLVVATPAAVSTAPAVKLAVAEKHMIFLLHPVTGQMIYLNLRKI